MAQSQDMQDIDLSTSQDADAPPYADSKAFGMLLTGISFVVLLFSGFSPQTQIAAGFVFIGSVLLYGLSSIAQAISISNENSKESKNQH